MNQYELLNCDTNEVLTSSNMFNLIEKLLKVRWSNEEYIMLTNNSNLILVSKFSYFREEFIDDLIAATEELDF